MNWLDAALIVSILVGVVIAHRIGNEKAAFLSASIVVGWLLAVRFSDALAQVLLARILVNFQPLASTLFYLAIVVLAAVAALRLFRKFGAVTSKLSPAMTKLGRIAVGLALGVVISGALAVGLTRAAFDVIAPWQGHLLSGLNESSLSPLYVRAARQVTVPALTSTAFDVAMDGMDSNIRRHYIAECTLMNDEGEGTAYGSGDICQSETESAVIWWPDVLAGPNRPVADILCIGDARNYLGGSAPGDSCASHIWHDCWVQPGYLMHTSNEHACGVVQRTVLDKGWSRWIASLPLPRREVSLF